MKRYSALNRPSDSGQSNMLRNLTESFAGDFARLLTKAGVSHRDSDYQLLKFERISPDMFVWLLKGRSGVLLVTISDISGDIPNIENICEIWLEGAVVPDELELVASPSGAQYFEDGFDSVSVYRLPANYEHMSDMPVGDDYDQEEEQW